MKIDKTLATKIVKKLKATKVVGKKRRNHDMYEVVIDGVQIVLFGVRHGSNKDQSHMHLIKQLELKASETRDLGLCPLSYDQWVEICKGRGLV